MRLIVKARAEGSLDDRNPLLQGTFGLMNGDQDMEVVQARTGFVPKPTREITLRHRARISDLGNVRTQGMTVREQPPDAGHEAAILDVGRTPFRMTMRDEVRPETPTFCVEGFEAMDNAGRHHGRLACFDDLASLANAKQRSSCNEMNDFVARMIMRAEGPGKPLAVQYLAMETIRLPHGQRCPAC
jgi:hypothetical protein